MHVPAARRSRPWLPVVAFASVSLLAAACSVGGASASPTASASPAASAVAPTSSNQPGGHAKEFTFGMPGEATRADRVIEVRMVDPFEFDPAQIVVTAGETITFRVTNAGSLDHEFVIGDEATQDEHEVMMDDGETGMEAEPNEVALAGGESGELTWTFTQAGSLLFGCHVPGHYEAGMVGTLEVSP